MFVYGKSPGGIGTGTDHHSAHFLHENRPVMKFRRRNVHHEPYGVHFLSEKRSMIDFQRQNGRVPNQNEDCTKSEYKISPGRGAGPVGCPNTAMAGKRLLIHVHPHTHSCYPNDFRPRFSSFGKFLSSRKRSKERKRTAK